MTDNIDMHQMNLQVIERFRSSGGHGSLGPIRFENLVLLTTTGRRTGQPRTVPLGFALDDKNNLLLFASNMGSPRHPDWYFNIGADAAVSIELTGQQFRSQAEALDGAEREDAYRRWIEMTPSVADHESRAGRTIPMVRIRVPAA